MGVRIVVSCDHCGRLALSPQATRLIDDAVRGVNVVLRLESWTQTSAADYYCGTCSLPPKISTR